MRKLPALILVLCLFAAPALAGDVNTPGKTPPPPPCETCSTESSTASTTTATEADYLALLLLELALFVVNP
jgi:hypothetical protein